MIILLVHGFVLKFVALPLARMSQVAIWGVLVASLLSFSQHLAVQRQLWHVEAALDIIADRPAVEHIGTKVLCKTPRCPPCPGAAVVELLTTTTNAESLLKEAVPSRAADRLSVLHLLRKIVRPSPPPPPPGPLRPPPPDAE